MGHGAGTSDISDAILRKRLLQTFSDFLNAVYGTSHLDHRIFKVWVFQVGRCSRAPTAWPTTRRPCLWLGPFSRLPRRPGVSAKPTEHLRRWTLWAPLGPSAELAARNSQNRGSCGPGTARSFRGTRPDDRVHKSVRAVKGVRNEA